jgi:hypothetical protein
MHLTRGKVRDVNDILSLLNLELISTRGERSTGKSHKSYGVSVVVSVRVVRVGLDVPVRADSRIPNCPTSLRYASIREGFADL